MLEFIYLDPAISKRLELLRRSGKKAALAAAKTEEIISRLKSGGEPPDQAGTLTRHGEKRIRGVRKYDLGSGYRLVAYRQRFRIYLLYVGTHDACHRWIENNRDLPLEMIQQRSRTMSISSRCKDRKRRDERHLDPEDDDDACSEELDDRHLRIIFSGLVQSAQTSQ